MTKKKVKRIKRKKVPDENMRKVGERIRNLRIQQGYTSFQRFAFEHNIDPTQWGRYERGEDLLSSTLFKMIRILGVTPEEFFKGWNENDSPQ